MTFQFETSGKLKILTDEELASADNDSAIIVYDDGMLADGTPYWLYVAVKPSKYRSFLHKALKREPITYNEYGAILKYGFEKEAPASVKDEMKQQYGCNDNFMTAFIENFKEAQLSFLKQQESKRMADIVAMLRKNQGA